jgi:hypothetical protein
MAALRALALTVPAVAALPISQVLPKTERLEVQDMIRRGVLRMALVEAVAVEVEVRAASTLVWGVLVDCMAAAAAALVVVMRNEVMMAPRASLLLFIRPLLRTARHPPAR